MGLNSSSIQFAAKGCAEFSSPMKDQRKRKELQVQAVRISINRTNTLVASRCYKPKLADIGQDLVSKGSVHILVAI